LLESASLSISSKNKIAFQVCHFKGSNKSFKLVHLIQAEDKFEIHIFTNLNHVNLQSKSVIYVFQVQEGQTIN
jgi:hypothetical protein